MNRLTFFSFLALFMLLLAMDEVLAQPQRNFQRGRALSDSNRANDGDYDYNTVEETPSRKYGRRGYRSNCKCSKISNCPKLQITIPRCPEEQFVCCFN